MWANVIAAKVHDSNQSSAETDADTSGHVRPVALVKKRVGSPKLTSRGKSLTDVSICIIKQDLRDSQRQVGAGAPRGGIDGFAECSAWQWASPGRGHGFNMSSGAFRRAGACCALGVCYRAIFDQPLLGARSTIPDHIATYTACCTHLIGQKLTFGSMQIRPGADRGCSVHGRLRCKRVQ